jgi:hypothetical protein
MDQRATHRGLGRNGSLETTRTNRNKPSHEGNEYAKLIEESCVRHGSEQGDRI